MNKQRDALAGMKWTLAGAAALGFAISYVPSLQANPTGAQVVSGTVGITASNPAQMTIQQGTNKAVVNWNSFSIGANESVNIIQPSATSAILNRVLGGKESTIAGRLRANGEVILVNPAGVIFAAGSSVNVGSMIASTLNISDADFLASNYHFVGASPGAVVNQGSLTAQSGGTIALLGGTVSNSGTVTARFGTVALGAGSDITLDFAGDGLTTLKINQGVANALLGNTGTLAADGGAVVMSAQSADALARTVINQQGIVRAQSLSERNGHILLDGGTNGVTQVSGTLDASGGAGLTGGRVDVTGYDVALLDGARVDASGAAGGGSVRYGGGAAGADPSIRNANAIWMSPSAQIHADALTNGTGGSVVAYSNMVTRVYGTLSATGGAQGGNGGTIETSGHYLDTTGAKIDASAPKGKAGSWTLDPDNIDIVAAASGVQATQTVGETNSTTFQPAGPSSQVVNTQVQGLLNAGTSVTISTVSSAGVGSELGDIIFLAPITKTATPANSTAAPTLTLNALRSITGNGLGITSTSGPLNITLAANANAPGAGTINGLNLVTNGGGLTIGGAGSVTITGVIGTTLSGDVSIVANSTLGTGVAITNSSIATTSGNVSVNGTSSSLAGGNMGVLIGNGLAETTASITTGTGKVNIMGSATGGGSTGVQINDGFISTKAATSPNGEGSVSVSGSAVAEAATETGSVGVELSNGSKITTNSGGVSVLGNADNAGVVLTSVASIVTTSGAIRVVGTANATNANGVNMHAASISSGSGNVTLSGAVSSASAEGVGADINSSSITTLSGNIALTGTSTGAAGRASVAGVRIENSLDGDGQPSIISTTSGSISIFGGATGPTAFGVLLADGSSISSANGPSIDIRGATAGVLGGATNQFDDYGVAILNGTIRAQGVGSVVSIAGSTNTSDAGVAIGAVPLPAESLFTSGPVTITAGNQGSIILRASNDFSTSSLLSRAATIGSATTTLALTPARVDATNNFAITALDTIPITLFGNVSGFTIDPQTFQTFSTALQTIILGSTTHTGLITVNEQCPSSSGSCTPGRPSFTSNLTLSNPGRVSHGITLPFGVSLPGKTLTLASAGPVTDRGGIQASGLLLAGPGTFTLTDPQNQVSVLAMAGAGNVDFLNSGSFVIGPIVSKTFNSASNAVTTIDATNSTLTGNLVAKAATGDIGLGGGVAAPGGPTGGLNTNLSSSGGTIDLVAEQGVFTNTGAGTLSAANAWRVWALTWNGETRGNVQPNTAQPNFYGCLFGAGCSWGGVVPTTGNHFVYVERPTVTVTADGKLRLIGAPNPAFTSTATGLINGDTAAGTLSGSLSSPATQASPAGQYAINPNFASEVGYMVTNVAGTLTIVTPLITITPRSSNFQPIALSGLQTFFGNDERTFVYENNLQGTNICVGSNQPLFTTAPPGDTQDLLAVEWKRVRSQPNLNSCMVLNGQHGCGDF